MVSPKPSGVDPVRSAAVAGLRYLIDDAPGFRREAVGDQFRYRDVQGRPIHNAATLERIRRLAIPPAWTHVWISPLATGHLQATGRDARGRKQYRYHARWREVRDENKYQRMLRFAQFLPRIRRRTARDLRRRGLPREKVLAAVVRLLELSLIRVGNEEYARTNDSFGLTTMRDRHVKVNGSRLRFEFRGKSGKCHTVDLVDARMARIVQRCQDIPGHELFQYWQEDNRRQKVDSSDVNQYLKEITGQDFTAKDFRTWAGTVLAALALQEMQKIDERAPSKRQVTRAIEQVAQRLGNTPAICRKCYIHPAVIDCYFNGTTILSAQLQMRRNDKNWSELRPEEAAVLALLKRRLKEEEFPDQTLRMQLRHSLQIHPRPGSRHRTLT